MNRRVKILIPAVLLAALAAGALWWALTGGDDDRDRLEVSGTVEATQSDLGFRVPGRIAVVHPSEGDRVAASELLATLDQAEMEAARAGTQASLEGARARLRELERGSRPEELSQAQSALQAARQQAEEARRALQRASRLHEGGAISEEAYDRAVTAAEVAAAHAEQAEQRLALVREGPRREVVEAQRAQVQAAEAALARAEAVLDDAVVRAPFAGIVTVRHREAGEIVPAGAPVLTLQDPDDRWVRIYVPGDRIGAVRLGQPADITSDTYPDRSYEGRVVFIGSEAEFTPRNVQTAEERTRLVYPVKVRITGDPSFDLKPGIPADVALDVGGDTGE